MDEEGHTSQFSRTKQRPPATDLSGPKASAESLTPRRSNLAVADAVDFQFDLFFPMAAPSSTSSLRGIAFGSWLGTLEALTMSERGSEGTTEMTVSTYRQGPPRVESREWIERGGLLRLSPHRHYSHLDRAHPHPHLVGVDLNAPG